MQGSPEPHSPAAARPVFKFGGTSMGSIARIEHVADLCLKHRPAAVVVSAMAGETNRLVALAKEISPRSDVPEYDMLVASGEQVSVALLALALRKRGLVPHPMLASHAGIRTDALFSRAHILSVNSDFLKQRMNRGELPVIAGFQGVTDEGQLTSLGRGGSDTSAVAVAAGLGASECVIYTDVEGVYTTDPRLCPKARLIARISYEEMLELASQGSKVLHIRSVHLAAKWGLRLVVRNTFTDGEGTEMVMEAPLEGEVVTGVACQMEEAWVRLGPLPASPTLLADVFQTLAEGGINVDIISQNPDAAGSGLVLNFTVAQTDLDDAQATLRNAFPNAPLWSRSDVAKVSIVGVGMRTHAGVAARMFRCFAVAGIEVLLVTTSEIKCACLVPRASAKRAVTLLHEAFLEQAAENPAP